MKKLFSMIVVLGLLVGCASGPPPADYGEVKDKNENYILIKGKSSDVNLRNKAADHCAQYNKFAYFYGWDFNGIGIFYRCKKGYAPTHLVEGNLEDVIWTNYDSDQQIQRDLTFTIDDKKEQCEAIGFEPQTEKFADCVLRLVELDVKSQQQAQIQLAISQGNQQVANELKAQRNQQSGAYLMDLGQKLLNPPTKKTTRCTVTGVGSFKTVSCR